MRTCSVAECGRRATTRGWCHMHYTRWRSTGDPTKVKKPHRSVVADGAKSCSRCGETKPLTEFVRANYHSTGYSAHCKVCRGHAKRAAAYGITAAEYTAMNAAQNGRCAVCDQAPTGGRGNGLVVDHDHATGAVRALLCGTCNSAIGLLREDPNLMLSAAAYLLQFRNILEDVTR